MSTYVLKVLTHATTRPGRVTLFGHVTEPRDADTLQITQR